jgi:DNA-binding transcriptional regulator YhcF (GntR family)
LESGYPLPPSGTLAEKLGVNRWTIDLTYAELQALGYLKSWPGSESVLGIRLLAPYGRKASFSPRFFTTLGR